MSDNNRIVFLDYLRVIACFMVMVVHATEPFYFDDAMNLHIATQADAWWVAIVDSAARACVPLFVIASSYLLFPLARPTGEFFRRRAVRILIPFFIWAAIYTWHFGGKWVELGFNFPSAGGHLWFVPMLLGLYLLMPLLSPWAEKASKREVQGWLCLWLVTAAFPFVRRLSHLLVGDPSFGAVPYLWGECPWNAFGMFQYVSGFFGYLLIGFYFRKFVPEFSWRKTLAWAIPLWVFGMAVMAGGFYFRIPGNGVYPVHEPYAAAVELEMSIEYCGLGVCASVLAFFLVIRKLTASGWFYKRVIRLISEASYGMYLMHIVILVVFVEHLKGSVPTPLAIAAIAAGSFAVSSVASVVIRRIPVVGRLIVG